MASNRPFTLIAAIIFLCIALLHVVRLFTHFQVILGSHTIPQYVSWIGLIVAGGLGLLLFREARR